MCSNQTIKQSNHLKCLIENNNKSSKSVEKKSHFWDQQASKQTQHTQQNIDCHYVRMFQNSDNNKRNSFLISQSFKDNNISEIVRKKGRQESETKQKLTVTPPTPKKNFTGDCSVNMIQNDFEQRHKVLSR